MPQYVVVSNFFNLYIEFLCLPAKTFLYPFLSAILAQVNTKNPSNPRLNKLLFFH